MSQAVFKLSEENFIPENFDGESYQNIFLARFANSKTLFIIILCWKFGWTFLMLPWGTVSDIDNKLNFCCEEVYKVYFLWLSSLASWHTFCIWSLVYFIFLFLNMGTWGRLMVLYLKGLWLANNQKTRLYLFLLKAELTAFLSPKSGWLLEQCCIFF